MLMWAPIYIAWAMESQIGGWDTSVHNTVYATVYTV